SEEIALGLEACLHPAQKSFIGQTIDLHVISFVEVAFWIGNSRGPRGIVRQQKQPFACLVEPSDRKDARQMARRNASGTNQLLSILKRTIRINQAFEDCA